MAAFGIKSREELGGHLRVIACVAAACRAATASEERKAATRRNPRQVTIGQILLLIALSALGLTMWRWNR
jgi:hypothetical protein